MLKNLANTEHYYWGDNCEGWHLVKNPNLSIIQERMPAGTSEKLHHHARAQQFFFILSGTATFIVEDKTLQVTVGDGLHILPGQRHRIFNETNTDLHFTVTSQPTSRGDRYETA